MTRLALATAVAALLLASSSARADDPEYIEKFASKLGNCQPSCYENEHSVKWDQSDYKRVCGYKEWHFESVKPRGSGWTPLASSGIPAVDPTETGCKAPPDSGGKWKSLVGQVKRAFKPLNVDLKNVRFAVQGSWNHDRDDHGDPRKWIAVRIYASNWGLKPNECGTHGTETVCEASGSKGARGFNYARFRLDEARKNQKANRETCLISSFAAAATARGLKKFRAGRIKKNNWTPGLTYKTRFDGELSEKELFAQVDEIETEAVALHKKCGGASPLVTAAESGHKPEFDAVPDPEFE
ncbi:MAG TPA: hypothetical protein VKB80_19120 [Kofleriaceae bacterium]|nr:hypothetical protein [Kofleriaceae bacterium]